VSEENLHEAAPDFIEKTLAEKPETEIVAETTIDEATEEEVELTLEEQLEAAKDEAAKNLDSFLRAQAELSNARKRFEKQRAMTYTNARLDLVRKMLPVFDDFSRAIETVPDEIREDNWFSGMSLVQRKFLTILESLDVKPIEAVGQMFDPNIHEAIGQEQSDEYESGVVTREMLVGYQIGDTVVRASLVYVAA
jgi:molecular chaperone GrpE